MGRILLENVIKTAVETVSNYEPIDEVVNICHTARVHHDWPLWMFDQFKIAKVQQWAWLIW